MFIVPKRIPEETKQRAIRLVLDHLDEYPNLTTACETVSARLGFGAESLRRWVRQAQVDAGDREGVTSSESERIRRLERENRELREASAMADSTGGRNEFCELLRWCQIAERFAWSSVERVLDRGQLSAGDDAQIGALRQVLA